MQRWDYLVESIDSAVQGVGDSEVSGWRLVGGAKNGSTELRSIADILADFGNAGWELVSMTPVIWSTSHDVAPGLSCSGVDGYQVVFKRPK